MHTTARAYTRVLRRICNDGFRTSLCARLDACEARLLCGVFICCFHTCVFVLCARTAPVGTVSLYDGAVGTAAYHFGACLTGTRGVFIDACAQAYLRALPCSRT